MSRRRHAIPARRARVWPWVVASVAVLVLVTGAAFAWDAWRLLDSKEALTTSAEDAKAALTSRDADALETAVATLEDAAGDFAGATDGPHWWLAAHLPWVQDQATPLIEAGRAVDAMATGALQPLASMGSLDALEVPGFEDGRIDPYVLEPYREALAQAAATLDEQGEVLAAVDLSETRHEIAEPFVELREQLDSVASLVDAGHVAAEVLPGMLGAEGERHYLVMVQNNAEPRTTGGIAGAIIELTVQDGRMTMGAYSSAGEASDRDGVGGLTEDEERIFTTRMEKFAQDVNFTPEFPRSAEMLTRMWANKHEGQIDGVISVDPVALGWMLEGAAPVELGPFAITGSNLAQVMLKESYLEYPDPKDQDAFFARASAELFGSIVSGDGAAVDGVERAIEARRFLVWSAHDGEQALLAPTTIAGAFLEKDDAVGVFFNDGSMAKIGYYVAMDTRVTNHVCTDGRLVSQTIDVTLTHTFDGDVDALPWYVSGPGTAVEPGVFAGNVLVYPAVGTVVTRLTEDGEETGAAPELHDGRSVIEKWVELTPGQTLTLSYEVTPQTSQTAPNELLTTPGGQSKVNESGVEYLVEGC
ncbi:DUF4012 domain-containing protein [Demequina gelatinilytica]|uniref:DUF4012 domain-containing protein n=1 Tax=Demequina gelatinilytica TaxID=1638980 RepID=UPI00078364D8|nr:DUF4012 domain-containing protein [Demequina gelatinilytica]